MNETDELWPDVIYDGTYEDEHADDPSGYRLTSARLSALVALGFANLAAAVKRPARGEMPKSKRPSRAEGSHGRRPPPAKR